MAQIFEGQKIVTPPLNHPFNRSHEKVVTPDHVSEDI
jgi:hypothetical protein